LPACPSRALQLASDGYAQVLAQLQQLETAAGVGTPGGKASARLVGAATSSGEMGEGASVTDVE